MKRKKILFTDVCLAAAGIVYLAFLLYLLLFKYYSPLAVITGNYTPVRSVNLVPFRSIYGYLFGSSTASGLAATNVFGNILIFVPMAVALRLYFERQTLLRAAFSVCMMSVAVEVVQLILGIGACDIDDVILNTLGGLIGAIGYTLLIKLCRGKRGVKIFLTVAAILLAGMLALVFAGGLRLRLGR